MCPSSCCLAYRMIRALVFSAVVALAAADAIPSFVIPGKCASVANKDGFDLRRVRLQVELVITQNSNQAYWCIKSLELVSPNKQ